MEFIPKEVHLHPEIPEYAQIERPLKDVIKDGYFRIAWRRLLAKVRFRRYKKRSHPIDGSAVLGYIADSVTPILPSLEKFGEYDLAISFLTPHNIVSDKVRAKKKVAWIHTDYSKIDVNAILELPVWSSYDYIASISDAVTDCFVRVFPSLKDRIIRIDNILSAEFVRKRAELIPSEEIEKEMPKRDGNVNFLSIGRFHYQKNFDNVPDICRRIIEMDCRVTWYLIGYGGDEALIRQKIAEVGMEKNVIILGKKSNPYPYIKACDIYVQPSRYEGNSVTVREAQMLCKPVIVTDYPTAKDQVKDGIDGVIVPKDNRGCAEGIIALAENNQTQCTIMKYLSTHDYGNDSEVDKIIDLLD